MYTLDFIRSSVAGVNDMVGIAMENLDDELINWQPGGTTNTIAQLLAHMITGHDLLINDRLVLGGGKTLHESGWAEKTGIPLARRGIWDERDSWRLNLQAFSDYRLAVYAGTISLLDSYTEPDLDRKALWINGPERPVARLFQMIYINHALGHCGEISTIKGLRGLKGLPF